MRVGILCAGDREAAPFLPLIQACKTTEKAMLTFHEGKIAGVEVVVLFSGVCKVNAAIAAQILIDTYGVEVLINAGTAGGICPTLGLFDVVISTEVAYHDVAPHILTGFHPWLNAAYFQADQTLIDLSKKAAERLTGKHRFYWGRMVTGETFVTDEMRPWLREQFGALTVDMESAAAAHVCHVNGIPFLAIRSVTDTESHSGTEHFEKNCSKAAAIARDVTIALLQEISSKEHI